MPPPSSASPRDVSLEGLREAIPDQYRTWVRSAVIACVVGYSITALTAAYAGSQAGVYLRQEEYALGVSLLALAIERRNRPMLAAYLMLFAVAAETCISFYQSPDGIRAASLPALPVVVMGAGLLLGPRAGYGFALGTATLALFLVFLSGRMGVGPGFLPQDAFYVSTLVVSLMGTAFVLHIFLRSFGHVLVLAHTNERRAADLLEAAPDGLLVVSPSGTIEAANEHAARALGLRREKFLGMFPRDLPLSSMGEPHARLDLADLETGLSAREFRATETGVAIEARARPVASADEGTSWLILLRDITERLEASQRERELAAQLQHAQKLEAVGQLAGGVAHDFNNLLTVVAGCADFVEDLPGEGAGEIAEELRSTYQRGVVLTRQLLAFARRDVMAPVCLNVSETLRGLEKLLRRLVGEQVRIELVLDETCPIVADPGQLEQVIINLAANARDAMPEGGSLRLHAKVDLDRVVLEVTDTGVGIDPAVRERMFEPFFTTKPRGKGTGLGLSTVHGIVQQSGGQISVNSRVGVGTRIEISWPKTDQGVLGRAGGLSRPVNKMVGQGLILLAEDDPHARKLIVRVLEEAGFDVMVAQDGAEALSMAVNLHRTPDLLLTDVVMPGMSGVELIDRVTRMHPHLRFILMSGYTDQELEPRAFNLSEDLIQKPFGREELLTRVFAKLAKRRGGRAAVSERPSFVE